LSDASVKLAVPNVGDAPLITDWFNAFTSEMEVNSESIKAPALVTFAVSVTSALVSIVSNFVLLLVTLVLNEALAACKESTFDASVVILPDKDADNAVEDPVTFALNVESVKSTANVLVPEMSPPPLSPVPAVIDTEVWSMCSFATNPLRLS